MSISKYIREIGRGKEGARSLSREQAFDLMSQVLDGRVTDLEIGAFALSMRIKGETVDETAGFLDAVHERCVAQPALPRAVLLPSYNGARKLPNLTALLALLLAQQQVPVIVHGPRSDPGRVTSAEVFAALGLPVARHVDAIGDAWSRREPVFVPIDVLCPALARLLDVRRVVGLRNSGHTVAKLLDPLPGTPSLRVMNYTHPEYGALLEQFIAATAANAMLLRGTEGEPVADARRSPRMAVYLRGAPRPELSRDAVEGSLAELPILPRERDATATAHYIQSVTGGETPVPAPIRRQVDALLAALAALADAPAAERSA